MSTIVKKKFEGQDIVLDGQTTYVNCSFTKCHFYYSGGDFGFINCEVKEPTVTFTGEAGKTLSFMQMMGLVAPPMQMPAVPQLPDAGHVH